MKVLLVDDEEGIRHQAKIFLEKIYGQLDVSLAASGKEAIQRLDKEYFAAVVSDYQMPRMNGIELLEELRDQGNDIPFIIFTGKGREEVAMKALNLGADGYIQKGGDVKSQYTLLANTIKQIVEKKTAERELIKSEREKSIILDSLSEHVIHLNPDLRIIWSNKEANSYIDKRVGDVVGERCHEVWFDQDVPCKGCPVLKTIETKKRNERIIGTEEELWYIRGEPILDNDGDLIGVLEVRSDITEKDKIRKKLEESEAKFKKLVETAPTAIFIVHDDRIVYVNNATEKITGYDSGELIDNEFSDLMISEQRDIVKNRIMDVQEGKKVPKRYEINIKHRDGSNLWLHISSDKIQFEKKDCTLIVAIDISEIKSMEKALVDDNFERK
ncbi:MAG: PAS domain S-box protein [Thermoplasmata archaeon]